MNSLKTTLFLAVLTLALSPYLACEADTCVVIPPMPSSIAYNSLEQYREALTAWQTMAKLLIERNVSAQPPAMPMPSQYRDHAHYQEALKLWQNLYVPPTAEGNPLKPEEVIR